MVNEIDLRGLLGMISRQFRFILAVAAIVVFLVGLASYSLTPKYTAGALLLVDTSSKNLLDPQYRSENGSFDDARVESEVEIIASDGVLLQVIRDEKLLSDPEFGIRTGLTDRIYAMFRLPLPEPPKAEKALGIVLQGFRRSIRVQRLDLTNLIRVEVVSVDAARAARLVNAITASYIDNQVGAKVASTIAARNIIQRRVTEASQAIAVSEKNLDGFIAQNLARIEKQTGSLGISILRQHLEKINQDRAKESARLEVLRQSLNQSDLDNMVASLETEAARELERQRSAIVANLGAAPAGSDKAVNLRGELARIEANLRKLGQEELTTLDERVSGFQAQTENLKQQIRTSILKSDLPPEVLTDIYSLQQSAEIARNQYQNLLKRLQDLDAESAMQIPDSRVVSAAMPPPRASFPNKMLFLLLGGVTGLGCGFGLAVAREYFVGGFTSDEQVETVLNLPLASVVPRQQGDTDDNGELRSISDKIVRSPLSVYSEAIRRVRGKIDQVLYQRAHGHGEERRGAVIIMVSSAEPAEGKTTFAVSLARTYALSGKKTLLIDCDLRKPSVHRHLGLEAGPGLNEFLRNVDGVEPLSSMTLHDEQTGLSVLIGGNRSNFATDDLFMGTRIVRLLTLARKHFEYVILDTPPIAPVVDAMYLARQVDIVAFVVKWAQTSQIIARRSVAQLAENARPGTPIIAILNQKELTKIDGYSRYSSYYTE